MERLKPFLIQALNTVFQPKTLYFQNETSFRKIEGLENLTPEVLGEPLTTLNVLENDLPFSIDIETGQKTGWFFDHRENRKLIASLCKGKTVIDYFCYSGGFSLLAAKMGAKKVIGVDRSETALKNAKATASTLELNNEVKFVCSDVFKDMDARIGSSEQFEVVILDPPAFVKVKKDIPVGLKGYEKLINKGLQTLAPNGLLLVASCSYHVKLEDLKQCLARALHKTNRQGRITHTLHAGPDHPSHPLLEESEYLKGFIVFCD
jgi:23S rRNA (cytosine1962-C5)-methyltransferase